MENDTRKSSDGETWVPVERAAIILGVSTREVELIMGKHKPSRKKFDGEWYYNLTYIHYRLHG